MKTPPRLSEAGGGGRQSKLRTARPSLPEIATAPQDLLAQLQLARQHLDRVTELLTPLADWRERVASKIACATWDTDLEDLKAEVALFRGVCRALARLLRRSEEAV